MATYLKKFFIYSRAPFFSAVVVPTLFGTALAYMDKGAFKFSIFLLTLFGVTAAHAGANLANDYYDYRSGNDAANKNRTPFSGGSTYLIEGKLPPIYCLAMSLASFAAAALAGGALAYLVDGGIGVVAALAFIGFLGGFFYTAPPFKFAYRGLGEVIILFCFGFLPVFGAYYVQTKTISAFPLLLSIPLALLITNIIWINQFPDYEADKAAGKKTLVVRLGRARSRSVYYLLTFLAYVSLVALALVYPPYWLLLLGFATLPVAIKASKILRDKFDEPTRLIPAQGMTVAVHGATGVLIALAALIYVAI